MARVEGPQPVTWRRQTGQPERSLLGFGADAVRALDSSGYLVPGPYV